MNTSFARPGLLLAAMALAAGGCATASSPEDARAIAVDLTSGGHVRIWSAYLRAGGNEAVVRGMVRADPLWRGPVSGHLHIVAYGREGQVLVRRAARWSGRLLARPGAASVVYQSALGVPRAQVARLAVAYAPGVHKASESFQ
jgi:hypothetical protein